MTCVVRCITKNNSYSLSLSFTQHIDSRSLLHGDSEISNANDIVCAAIVHTKSIGALGQRNRCLEKDDVGHVA